MRYFLRVQRQSLIEVREAICSRAFLCLEIRFVDILNLAGFTSAFPVVVAAFRACL